MGRSEGGEEQDSVLHAGQAAHYGGDIKVGVNSSQVCVSGNVFGSLTVLFFVLLFRK